MSLIDTTPLVALCDPRDSLHERAFRDLARAKHQPFVACEPVLTEACLLLGALVVLATRVKKAVVWTYDAEFWDIWRALEGQRIPLFVDPRR